MKRAWLLAFVAVLALFVLLDVLLSDVSVRKFPWSNIPAFYGLFGFLSCIGLVLVSKFILRWLQRSEDYYDRKDNRKDRR